MFRYLIQKAVPLLVPLALLAGCWKSSKNPARSIPVLNKEIIRIHNEGVALMGRFDYENAYQKFEQLAEKYRFFACRRYRGHDNI